MPGVRSYYLLVDETSNTYMTDFDFGELIRSRRKELGKGQEETAQEAGMTFTTYGRIERGQVRPKLDQIRSIFSALGLSFALFDEESAKPERISAQEHLDRIAYHTGELKKMLGR